MEKIDRFLDFTRFFTFFILFLLLFLMIALFLLFTSINRAKKGGTFYVKTPCLLKFSFLFLVFFDVFAYFTNNWSCNQAHISGSVFGTFYGFLKVCFARTRGFAVLVNDRNFDLLNSDMSLA